jgi:uncharacterized membrane protein YvbJ
MKMCPACRSENIEDSAVRCPRCGTLFSATLRTGISTAKIFAFVLLAIFTLLLGFCAIVAFRPPV